ncbi:Imm9 family immunity protein [Klebsiella aerogenes]|uniref:Imm9 family immunity protein n=1 Tax=Klebsiella aerogenes TaxID=548 RepID=UPI002277CA2A|nr:Imm9 family immunity protein [Klebsiella aerogenes]MCY4764102.1 immunity 9 family protein [Klebsiella aerogenes]
MRDLRNQGHELPLNKERDKAYRADSDSNESSTSCKKGKKGNLMRFKVQITPEIFDFPNLHKERVELENYVHELTRNSDAEKKLPEWSIRFLCLLGGEGHEIGIYKKGATYTSELMKSYTIYIPIPTSNDIFWGVEKEKYAHRSPIDKSKMKMLSVNFNEYNNVKHYILACSKIGILDLLKTGFSLKGVKFRI